MMEYRRRSATFAGMWRAVLLSWWLFGTLASCCPHYCRCFADDEGYKVANCSKSGLVSGDPAPTIDVLNFKNQVRGTQTKLEARIFRNFRGVRYLNLQNTSISQLPTDVFYGLNRVSRLDLSFNKIKHLNGVVFKSLPNLRYLSLRGNFLSISPLEVIVSETLQDLDMGYCSITNIPLYTFSSAPNIRQLILDGNFIQTLEYNVLPKGLTYLNLANNNIVKPPINVFNSLRHLVRLDISNNPINCSCSLLVFQDTLSGRAGILENDVRCNNPPHLFGREISTVNENQLCRDDYINREGLNGLIHLRTKKSHHHNHHQYNVQSDEPFMGDESYGPREAAEVMFNNDETNQMGTHMEARAQGVSPDSYGETSDNNKVIPSTDDALDKSSPAEGDEARVSEDTDVTDQENHSATEPAKLQTADRELLEEEQSNPKATEDASVEVPADKSVDTLDDGAKSEDLDPDTPEGIQSTSTNDGSSTNSLPSEAASSSNQSANPLHGSEPATQYATSADEITSPPELTHQPHWKSDSGESHSTDLPDDVETFGFSMPDHESLLHLESEPTTSENPRDLLYTTSSASEPSDYSYDSQHDYGAAENVSSSETYDEAGKLPETVGTSSSTPESDVEGSGDFTELELTSSENGATPSSTIGFMEEQEGETESTSLRTVSDDLADISSTTVSSIIDTGVSSSTESSTAESPTDDSAIDITTEPTQVSSETPSTESSSPSEPSVEPYNTETSSEASSSTLSEDPAVAETTTELIMDSSSTSEASSPLLETEYISSTTAVSWEVSSTAEPSSSTEKSSQRYWWESREETPISSTTEESSSPIISYKKPKMIELTTEKSTTEASEVELVSDLVGGLNQNIVADPNQNEDEKTALISGVTYIIIGLLLALVLILLSVVICRRKSPATKVRLPVDPEIAAGTEMQDMLLPKTSSGNGVKVSRPNAYTNGSAAPLTNGKAKLDAVQVQDPEETIPVLQASPEHEPERPEHEIPWKETPEPIEAVTARLTMLARPQTPIFIQKPSL